MKHRNRLLTLLVTAGMAASMLAGLAMTSKDVSFNVLGGKAGMKRAGRTGTVNVAVEDDVEVDEILLVDEDGNTLARGEEKKGVNNAYVLKAGKALGGKKCKIVVKPKAGSGKVETSEPVRFPKR